MGAAKGPSRAVPLLPTRPHGQYSLLQLPIFPLKVSLHLQKEETEISCAVGRRAAICLPHSSKGSPQLRSQSSSMQCCRLQPPSPACPPPQHRQLPPVCIWQRRDFEEPFLPRCFNAHLKHLFHTSSTK